ncbi:hypothetical protein [Crenothrix polyspora]|uniref:Uncharacterized protein n=1 Tax=Crenothrix polyspora TaxID=360316 RepID=A0A1R4HIJ9_9GAMM|nr:hypothetical protein [Crenothrix polyspora]SJM96019.1 hypothetical protein CRENPOLYSF1_830015 [Crenothrix polyspora]
MSCDSNNNSTQAVPFGSGSAFVTLIRKTDGTCVEPPQAIAIEGIQDISWDNKSDLKEMHGQGAYASRLAGGKKSLSLSMTVSEISGKQLNALCFGQDVEERQLKISRDRNGHLIPESNTVNAKILNSIHFNLARVDSVDDILIAGIVAIQGTSSTPAAGEVRVYSSTNIVIFSAEDVGKTAIISYTSNGTGIQTTFKIPADRTYDMRQVTRVIKVIKGTVTALPRVTYRLTDATPNVENYSASDNGVLIFNPAQTGVMTISHTTDAVAASSKIDVLPAAAYGFYIDPPSSAKWLSPEYVMLASDSGTPMTGVVAGETLVQQAALGTLGSGKYLVDNKGYYLFDSADAGDTVKVSYRTDYQFMTVTPPNNGIFLRNLGVRHQGGITLDRVALTNPLSLLHNQYAVSDNGSYYFDATNAGDTLFIDYQYEATGGQTIVVVNNKIGESPTLMVDLLYEMDGEMMTVSFERVKMKGCGVATKQDDFAPMKFELQAFANKATGIVYSVSTSV